MTFLETNDLESQLFKEFIDDSTDNENLVLNTIEEHTIALVKSKLGKRYDVTEIFNKSGTDRNKLIISVLVPIVIYKLIRRNATRKMPEDIVNDYKYSLKWLDQVRDGIETPDLPIKQEEKQIEVHHGNSKNENWYI